MRKTRAETYFSPLIRPNFSRAAAPSGEQRGLQPLQEGISTHLCCSYSQIPLLKGICITQHGSPRCVQTAPWLSQLLRPWDQPPARAGAWKSQRVPGEPENFKTSWFLRVPRLPGARGPGLIDLPLGAMGTGEGQRRRGLSSPSPGKGEMEPGTLFYPGKGGTEPVNALLPTEGRDEAGKSASP